MPTVLLYNIEPKKAAGIKMLCSMLAFDYRIVESEDFGRPIGVLLGLSDDESNETEEGFSEELLYLADIDGGMLDIFLYQLRKKKLSVALKAVKTPTNLTFTSHELFRHLSAEREAIAQGRTAHNE